LYNEQSIADTRKTISDLRTNGLLRRYFPQGTDFMTLSEEEIKLAIDNLNHRPRKPEVTKPLMNYLQASKRY